MIRFIDEYRSLYGVEPICRVIKIAPSTYYAHAHRHAHPQGILRGGLQFVPYLEPGHYVGVDISGTRLEQGRGLMDEAGIARDSYSTFLVHDCSLKELGDRKFDYVWAHAVVMHMPEPDIRAFLSSLKKHLNPAAAIFFTYFPSERLGLDRIAKDHIRDFYYPTEYLKDIFESMGYDFVIMPKGYKENWGTRTRARLTSDQH